MIILPSALTRFDKEFWIEIVAGKDWHLRLMDGGSSCAGRVEIYYKGTWGTVCDDSWGSLEAEVACKQLGCGSAVNTTAAAPCGRASGQVWLDEVRCTGNESCLSPPWGEHNCDHSEDVGVVCSGNNMFSELWKQFVLGLYVKHFTYKCVFNAENAAKKTDSSKQCPGRSSDQQHRLAGTERKISELKSTYIC
uniref:SRCR domain-containing protein n=1 Tax=Callorhinchus milii TaxID=7868 RepID=A0A4W3IJ71_CALMI